MGARDPRNPGDARHVAIIMDGNGRWARRRGLLRVIGHEMVGEVLETGPEVRSVRPGDRVACPFTTSCGQCFYCARGLTCRCTEGQLFGWVEGGEGHHDEGEQRQRDQGRRVGLDSERQGESEQAGHGSGHIHR